MATYFTSTDRTREIEAPTSAPYVLVNRTTDEVIASGKSRTGLQEMMEVFGITAETARIAATRTERETAAPAGPSQADLLRLAIAKEALNSRRR